MRPPRFAECVTRRPQLHFLVAPKRLGSRKWNFNSILTDHAGTSVPGPPISDSVSRDFRLLRCCGLSQLSQLAEKSELDQGLDCQGLHYIAVVGECARFPGAVRRGASGLSRARSVACRQ